MKSFIFLFLFFVANVLSNTCPCQKPILNVGSFSTFGEDPTSLLITRMGLLGGSKNSPGYLRKAFDDLKLDVLCLPETWQDEIRTLLFSNFQEYSVFIPPRIDQVGCQNACSDTVQVTHNGETKSARDWIKYCTTSPFLPNNQTCSSGTSELQFLGCVTNFCSFIIVDLLKSNPACLVCMSNPVVNGTLADRVTKCTTNYNPIDEAKCRLGYGGNADTPVITRKPPLEKEYISFPSQINYLDNRGVNYVKVKTDYGVANVFCSHLISQYYNTSTSDVFYEVNRLQTQFLLNYVQTKSKPGEVTIVLGDFNNGRGSQESNTLPVWESNYDLMTDAGFKDVFQKRPCTFGCNKLAELTSQYPPQTIFY